jgi:hypothetical protein
LVLFTVDQIDRTATTQRTTIISSVERLL